MEQSRAAAPTLDWVAVPSHVAEGPAEVRHKDGWLVCLVPADSYAKLIAAAPELLEALREFVAGWDRIPGPARDKMFADADAAIRKATT